jgi:hypothetical protein
VLHLAFRVGVRLIPEYHQGMRLVLPRFAPALDRPLLHRCSGLRSIVMHCLLAALPLGITGDGKGIQ